MNNPALRGSAQKDVSARSIVLINPSLFKDYCIILVLTDVAWVLENVRCWWAVRQSSVICQWISSKKMTAVRWS